MPATTLEYPFRPLLTASEIKAVYVYMQRSAERTGNHISLHDALERLLRSAIERERARQHD